MGYFNFYILKRVLYNLSAFFRKHKIITLFVVSFIIFGFKKAFCYEVVYNNTTYRIPDGVTHYIITENYPQHYRTLVYTKDDDDFKTYGVDNNFRTIVKRTTNNARIFYYRMGNTTTTDFTALNELSRTENWAIYNTPIYRNC